jgi:tetratricopeptide (TPR) repeat protein
MFGYSSFSALLTAICLVWLGSACQAQTFDFAAQDRQVSILSDKAQYKEATALARANLQKIENTIGTNHANWATAAMHLGQLLEKQARPKEALPWLQRALAWWEENRLAGHPDIALAQYQLAIALHQLNRFSEAYGLLRRALAVQENKPNNKERAMARTLTAMAYLDLRLARLASARQHAERAVGLLEHRGINADLVDALHALYSTLDAYDDEESAAQNTYERIQNLLPSVYAPDDIDLNYHLTVQATLLRDEERYTEALAVMARVSKSYEKTVGNDNALYADAVWTIGTILAEQGQWKKALECYDKAESLFEQAYGSTDANIAALSSDRGIALQQLNQLEKAQAAFQRAAALFEKLYGRQHPVLAQAQDNLTEIAQAIDQQAAQHKKNQPKRPAAL